MRLRDLTDNQQIYLMLGAFAIICSGGGPRSIRDHPSIDRGRKGVGDMTDSERGEFIGRCVSATILLGVFFIAGIIFTGAFGWGYNQGATEMTSADLSIAHEFFQMSGPAALVLVASVFGVAVPTAIMTINRTIRKGDRLRNVVELEKLRHDPKLIEGKPQSPAGYRDC